MAVRGSGRKAMAWRRCFTETADPAARAATRVLRTGRHEGCTTVVPLRSAWPEDDYHVLQRRNGVRIWAPRQGNAACSQGR